MLCCAVKMWYNKQKFETDGGGIAMTEGNVRTLCDGVDFQSIQNKAFKTTRITVHFLLPLEQERAAANAVLTALLCRASREYPTYTALSRRLEELYGASLNAQVRKQGDAQLLSISAVGLADRFALHGEAISVELAALLCSVIFDPPFENGVFCKADFDQEVRQTCELIDAEFNDKKAYAKERCIELMCRKEAYGLPRYGTKRQVQALTPQELTKAWEDLIAQARVRITAFGNCDPELVYNGFAKAFAKVKRKKTMNCGSMVIETAGDVQEINEPMEVAQSKLVMGFRTKIAAPQEQVYAEKLMTAMFGGTPHSKLFLNVREKLSLCYYCAARYNSHKGILTVESGVETKNIDAAKAEILNQLEKMQAGDFTDEEIAFTKLSVCNQYRTVGDYLSSMDDWYTSQLLLPQSLTPEQAAEKINRITREEIIYAAQQVTLDTVYRLVGAEEAE